MTRPSRPSDPQHALTLRAWYSATTEAFLRASPDAVLGQLAANSGFAVSPNQRDAWLAEIEILQEQLAGLSGSVFLEFSIPRMGKRIDAVLLVENVVVAVEFKVGETRYERGAIEQVWDYALDLKNFHEASHSLAIVPVLIATGAAASHPLHLEAADDGVYRPVCANRRGLRRLLEHVLTLASESRVDGPGWALAPYHPTPTIVEAARALYAQHSLEAIARFDAGAQNLAITSARIEEIVDEARSSGRKAICLVTGVPGAGKTLVGLNLATRRSDVAQPTHAVFLSGNGPLVAVLREALTRDELARRRQEDHKVRKGTPTSPFQQVAFPVTGYRAILDRCRPLPNRNRVQNLTWAGTRLGPGPRVAEMVLTAQVLNELAFEDAPALDKQAAIDGFGRHLHVRIAREGASEPARNLLWRPLLGESGRYRSSQPWSGGQPAGLRTPTSHARDTMQRPRDLTE